MRRHVYATTMFILVLLLHRELKLEAEGGVRQLQREVKLGAVGGVRVAEREVMTISISFLHILPTLVDL